MWNYYRPPTPVRRKRPRVAALLPGIGSTRLIIPRGGDVSFPLSGLRDFLRRVVREVNGGTEPVSTTAATTTSSTTKPAPVSDSTIKLTTPIISSGGQLYTTQAPSPVSFADGSGAMPYIAPQRVEGEVAPDPLTAELQALAASGSYGVPVAAEPAAAESAGEITPTTWALIGLGLFAAFTMLRKRR